MEGQKARSEARDDGELRGESEEGPVYRPHFGGAEV